MIFLNNKVKLYRLVSVGLMSALVFVASQISIPVPSVIGISRIHLGNIFCLLSGFLLGSWRGGLSAGFGSMLYDMTNPAYIAEAPITFINKFLLAFVCGLIVFSLSKKDKLNVWVRNIISGVAGSLTYVVLYLGKAVINDRFFLRTEWETVLIDLATRAATSLINAVIAVVIAVPLAVVLRKTLIQAKLEKFIINSK